MPNEEPENPGPENPPPESKPRRAGLTREQRQLLNTPRSATPPKDETPTGEREDALSSPPAERASLSPPPRESEKPAAVSPSRPASRPSPAGAAPVGPRRGVSRVLEMQQAALIIGAIVLVLLAFLFGQNFQRLKYMVLSRTKAPTEKLANDYPGVSAPDLVDQALQDEKAGHWQDAVKKLLAAKQKDLRYRGLFLRMGKLFFTHDDYDSADKAFERAIAFNEDVGESYQFRGLIATKANDYTAAQHFFEEATRNDPLMPDYYYFWAEALRLALQPQLAIPRYEEARVRAHDEQDARVCAFKIQLARMEAAESPKVASELAKKAEAGPLPVDWLMTAAALKIREGKVPEAIGLIDQARAGKWPGLFTSCASDMAFKDAARKHPELALPLHLDVPQHATIR